MSSISVLNNPTYLGSRVFRVEDFCSIRGNSVSFAHFSWQGRDFYCRIRSVWRNTHLVGPVILKRLGSRKKFKTRINLPNYCTSKDFVIYPPQCGVTDGRDFSFAGFHKDACADIEFLVYEDDRLGRIPLSVIEDEKIGRFKIVQPPAGLIV